MKYFQSTFSLMALLFSAGAYAGVNGSGGGNACWIQNHLVIKDLAPAIEQGLISDTEERKTPQLKLSPLVRKLGFDLITLPSGPWQALLKDRLQFLQSTSPKLHALLSASIRDLKFAQTSDRFPKAIEASFKEHSLCNPDNTRAVALYWKGYVFLSIPTFNALSDVSIATLVVHEGLRRIQQTYSTKTEFRGLNNELEDLTLKIILKTNDLDDSSSFLQRYFKQLSNKELSGFCNGLRSLVKHAEDSIKIEKFCSQSLEKLLGNPELPSLAKSTLDVCYTSSAHFSYSPSEQKEFLNRCKDARPLMNRMLAVSYDNYNPPLIQHSGEVFHGMFSIEIKNNPNDKRFSVMLKVMKTEWQAFLDQVNQN